MTKTAQHRIALFAGTPAGLMVMVCLAMLVWSYLSARAQAPQDEQRIADLQAKVETDASFAPTLADEYERQSKALRARKAANESVAIALIAAATLFIACAKWLVTLRGRHAPSMHELVQVRISENTTGHAPTTNGREPAANRTNNTPAVDECDVTFVDDLVARIGGKQEAAIPILQAIQSHYRYLPDEALQRVCELTDITPSQIAGTSSFYSQFRRSPVGAHVVRVCHGTACHVAGARQITDELRRHLAIPDDADTDAQRIFTIDEVACLGCCSLAPVLMVDDHTAGKLTPSGACAALQAVDQEVPV